MSVRAIDANALAAALKPVVDRLAVVEGTYMISLIPRTLIDMLNNPEAIPTLACPCCGSKGWISAKEQPPKQSGEYLCSDGMTIFLGWYNADHGLWWESDGAVYFAPLRVTHWMEKPKLPK